MKHNRQDLLRRLLCVEPGISKQESLQQSSCVVFRRGWLYSLSQEVSCAIPSGLNRDLDFATGAEKLIKCLEMIEEEEVEIKFTDKSMMLKTEAGDSIRFAFEADVVLPVDQVERPEKNKWKKLDVNFPEAVEMCSKCCKKKDFPKDCIHLCGEWMESCDNERAIRYQVVTPLRQRTLLRGESLKKMSQLGMTKIQETGEWLHFWNPFGLRFSVRKVAEGSEYPPLEQFLSMTGKPVEFPKSLKLGAELAGLFAGEERITLQLSRSQGLVVTGRSPAGEYEKVIPGGWDGEDVGFGIFPKVLTDLLEKHSGAEVTEVSLRVDGGRYVFVTSLVLQGKTS